MSTTTERPIKFHLAEDTINREDIDRLIGWLQTYPRLTQGEVTREFENKWGQWVGKKHSLFCNSGSSANLLMFAALLHSGKLKNKKVVVPSVGWATTISPAIQLGYEPIMCEADPDTILKRDGPATVILVQVLGVPHKMDALMDLKSKYGFYLLEDACAAVGAYYREKKVGQFGDMSSFSYYFGHQMSTIEGGMVSTDDKEMMEFLRMFRSHGWSKDLEKPAHEALVKKHNIDDFHTPFVFYIPGYNLRSTDLNAFVGIGQIEKLDWMSMRRQKNHARYRQRLGEKFRIQKAEDGCVICSIHFGAVAENVEQRKKIVTALTENGIETRIFSAGNLGLHPFWTERYGKASFPVADKIHHCGFFLPNHPTLSFEDVDSISKVVLGCAENL